MQRIIIGFIFMILFGSCSVPDENSSQFSQILYFRLAKQIERRVFYNTKQNEYEIPDYISFENRIKSEYGEVKPISILKYNLNFSEPFEFYIDIKLLNPTIKEIEILNCELYANDDKYNLFENTDEKIKLIVYQEPHYELDYNGNISDHKIIIKNIINNEYKFSLVFKKLPFDFKTNEDISILYTIVVTDESDKIIKYNAELLFNRSIVEKRRKNDKITWIEIKLENW
jgi:hypothetical protein